MPVRGQQVERHPRGRDRTLRRVVSGADDERPVEELLEDIVAVYPPIRKFRPSRADGVGVPGPRPGGRGAGDILAAPGKDPEVERPRL